jgi:hypothetical protein
MNDRRRSNVARVLKWCEVEHARRARSHRNLFVMSIILGITVVLYPYASHANTITIDVNSANPINYNEVDKFNAAQDKQAKFAEVDINNPNQLIFSAKPIIQTPKSVAYTPKKLADLGWKINSTMTDTYGSVVKATPHSIVSGGLMRMPSLAQLNLPTNTVQTSAAQAPVTTVTAATPTAVATPPTRVNNIYSANLPLQSVSQLPDAWTIGAGLTLLLLLGLLINEKRQTRHKSLALTYKGQMGAANEMIGKGKLFDFNTQAQSCEMLTVNTAYLNMLWQVGKFSRDGAINTYFYMAYFIPSQQAYAAELRRKRQTVKPKENV